MTQAAGVGEQIVSPWKRMLASVSIEESAAQHGKCCMNPTEGEGMYTVQHHKLFGVIIVQYV